MSSMPISILLIDDDTDDNFIHTRAIEKSGINAEVAVCIDGKQALEHLRNSENRPDIIFLDVNMPIMGGWELLENLSDQGIEVRTLILLSTSSSYGDETRANTESLITQKLPKPLTKEKILQVVEEHVERS